MSKSYKEIREEIARLEDEAKAARDREIGEVVKSIRELMSEYNLTITDLGLRDVKKSAKAITPKYRDPKTQEAWSGRGRTPQWVAKALAEGRESEIIVKKDAPVAAPAIVAEPKKPAVAKPKPAVAKKPAPAKKPAVKKVTVKKEPDAEQSKPE